MPPDFSQIPQAITFGQKDSLSAAEICTIISICAEKGIAELKFGGLDLKFAQKSYIPAPGPVLPAASVEVTAEQLAEEKKGLEREEILLREEQLAELLITDPLQAEELMEQGLLKEGAGHGGDGDGEH